MTATAESILSNLLTLPEEDRLEIAARLQDSVYATSSDEELSRDLKVILDRRWQEIESGAVQCRDALEVVQELRAKYNA